MVFNLGPIKTLKADVSDELTGSTSEAVTSVVGVCAALYYWNTDSDGHHYGPFSPQLERTLDSLDSQILRLQRLLDAVVSDRRQVALSSFVNIIVVSDHGMKLVSTARRPKQHVNIFRHIRRAQLFMFLLKGPVGQLWPVKSQLDDVSRPAPGIQYSVRPLTSQQAPVIHYSAGTRSSRFQSTSIWIDLDRSGADRQQPAAYRRVRSINSYEAGAECPLCAMYKL